MSEQGLSDVGAMEVATLRGLAEQALLAQRGEATLDVEALSARLRGVAERGGPPELGGVLLGLLESGALATVRDPRGHSCRALAVKALLALDVPESRQVSPEDLAFAQARQWRPPHWMVPLAAIFTAFGGVTSTLLAILGPTTFRIFAEVPVPPPVDNLVWGLHGVATLWRAVKLVLSPAPGTEDLRAMLLLAGTSVPLFLVNVPRLLDGGPASLTGPLFAGVPAALAALLLWGLGVKPRS
ncbi:hypothetical protein [Pyxidicoccus xibeiensis]|uniref:hypothetical protein n=1 Tax=Pyxidicoccus xibeiensis TaxID=2906759 RepID=UPI0020A7BCA5|nr:hypothetical protein [Pyxidicoccus xibeiensis]MCP3141835.1 hypothetical protein [Pyxidicoccus xibeiensis]